VHSAVLAEARRIAAARAMRPAANDASYWRPAVAVLAIVAVAGILLSTMFRDPAVLRVAPPGHEVAVQPESLRDASPAAAQIAPLTREQPVPAEATKAAAEPPGPPVPKPAANALLDDALLPTQPVADLVTRERLGRVADDGARVGIAAASPPAPAAAAKALAHAESNTAGGTAAVSALARPSGAEALQRAALAGDETLVVALLDAGAAVDAPDADGRSALLVAAGSGRSAVVRVLLARGAAVNARDQHGQTALALARARHDDEMATLLERAGGHD
jgi:anti-sigma-K factor RskA